VVFICIFLIGALLTNSLSYLFIAHSNADIQTSTVNISNTVVSTFSNDLLGGNLSPWGAGSFWPKDENNALINQAGLSLMRAGHGQKVRINMEELYPAHGVWNWDTGTEGSINNQIAWWKDLNMPILYTLNDEISTAMLNPDGSLNLDEVAYAWSNLIKYLVDQGVNVKYVEIGNEIDIAPMEGIQRPPVFYKPLTNNNVNPHFTVTNEDASYSRRVRVEGDYLYLERNSSGWQVEHTVNLLNSDGSSRSYGQVVTEINNYTEWSAVAIKPTFPTGSTRYSNYIADQTTQSIAFNETANVSGFGDYLYIRDIAEDMTLYKNLYKKAYEAIKSLTPDIKVGPFPAGQGSKAIGVQEYGYEPYSTIYSNPSYNADFFAYHAYSFGGSPRNFSGITNDDQAKQAIVDSTYKYDGTYKWEGQEPYTVQQKLADFGKPNIDLLCTEFNYDGLGQYHYPTNTNQEPNSTDIWKAIYFTSVISKTANVGVKANTFWDIFAGSDTDELISPTRQITSMGYAMKVLSSFNSSSRQVLSSNVTTDDKPSVLYQSSGGQETHPTLLGKAKRVESLATKDTAGNYKILLLNKSVSNIHNITVNLDGVKNGTANINSYNDWSALSTQTPISSSASISGGSFSVSMPPMSMAVIDISDYTAADTIDPAVSITSPADNAPVAGNVTINADASDNEGDSELDKAELYVNDELKDTDISKPYSFTWDSTTVDTAKKHIIKIKAYDKSGNSAEDSVSLIVQNGPIVSFTFDDSNKEQYNYFPALNAENYPGVVYAITGSVGNSDKLSLSQLNQMKTAGWEISSHTTNHWPALKDANGDDRSYTAEDYLPTISDAKDWLISKGFSNPGFAAPFTRTNEVLDPLVESYHPYNRKVSTVYNSLPVTDSYNLGAVGIDITSTNPPDPDPIKQANNEAARLQKMNNIETYLTNATEQKKWIIFADHGWMDDAHTADKVEIFEEVIAKVKAKGIPVKTVLEVVTGEKQSGSSSQEAINPTVTLTAPSDAATVSGSVSLSATAADNDGGSGVEKVEFLIDDSVANSDNASPYSYSWNSSTATNGSHTIKAKAYDIAGNATETSAITVTVNNSSSGGATSDKPVVSFTFTDNNKAQIDDYYPILSAAGYKGVTYVDTALINSTSTRLSTTNLQTLQAAGWEIGSHSANNLSGGVANYQFQVEEAKNWLVANGFSNLGFSHVNALDIDALNAIVQSNHDYNVCSYGTNTFPVNNKYNLKITGLTYASLGTVQTKLAEIEANGGWLIFQHEAPDDVAKVATFQSIVSEIKNNHPEIEVKTVNEVLNPSPILNHIEITPSAPQTIDSGDTILFSAKGYDVSDNEIPGITFTWSGANEFGLFNNIVPDNYDVKASANGIESNAVTVTVNRIPATYYVAKTGSDSNPGTQSQPWLTIQKAANVAQAGDTVYVKEGTYNERIKLSVSGQAENYITFEGFPGDDKPVTQGFTIGPTRSALTSYIKIKGFEITQTPPDYYDRWGITINGSNNVIENNYIHDIRWNGIGAMYDCSNEPVGNIIKNNTITNHCNSAIEVGGSNWLVEGNDLSHGRVKYQGQAVNSSDTDAHRFSGTGHIIRNENIHDYWLSDNPDSAPHIDAFQTFSDASNIIFEGNYVHDAQVQWAQITGGYKDWQDIEHHVDHLTFRNNVFEGAISEIYNGFTIYNVPYLTFVNNTFINAKVSDIYIAEWDNGSNAVGHPCDHAVIKNNIFYKNNGEVFNNGGHLPYTINQSFIQEADNNLYYPVDLSNPPLMSQQEAHKVWNLDPKFVSTSAKNYHIGATSPAINAGISDANTPATDKDSNERVGAPDIGAFEYQPKTYYVAKTGSDSNPGTEAEPFLTIQKAAYAIEAGVVQDGDTIQVGPGDYRDDPAPTTYPCNGDSAYAGRVALLKSGLTQGITFKGVGMPLTKGFLIGRTSIPCDRITIDGFDIQATRRISQVNADAGIALNGAYVTIKNCNIHHCPKGGVRSSNVSSAQNVSNLTVTGCTFSYNYSDALEIWGDNGTVTNCDFSHGQSIVNSAFVEDTDAIDNSGESVYIANNTFHDYLDSENTGTGGSPHMDCLQQALGGDGGGIIENNHMYDFNGAFAMLAQATGKTISYIIRNNVIEEAAGSITVTSGTVEVYNNYLHNVANSAINTYATNGPATVTAKNNVLIRNGNQPGWSSVHKPFMDAGGISNWTTDYNLAWPCTSSPDAVYAAGTYNQWNVDPLIDSNFKPLSGSPLIGAGIAISGVTADYEGNTRSDPPTIGAYEYQGSDPNAIYVSTTGNDTTGDGTTTNPYRTIQKGADVATAGKTVYVRGGTYSETVTLTKTGTPGNMITFKNFPGEKPIIDNNKTNRGFYLDGDSSYIRIEGFEIKNCYPAAITTNSYAYHSNPHTGVEIVNNDIHDTDGPSPGGAFSIKFQESTNCLVKDNKIGRANYEAATDTTHPSGKGVDLSRVCTNFIIEGNEIYDVEDGIWIDSTETNNIIQNNYFHDIDAISPAHADAIQMYASDNEVSNNLFIGNPGKDGSHLGIYVQVDRLKLIGNVFSGGGNYHVRMGGEDLTVMNNVFANGQYGIRIYDTRDASWASHAGDPSGVFKNNIFYGDSWDPYQNQFFDVDYNLFYVPGGTPTTHNQTHSIWADPKFVDINNSDYLARDFHLQATSPAINAGTSDGAPDKDKDGNPRVGAVDIGAYEYQGTPTTDLTNPTVSITNPTGDAEVSGTVDIIADASDDAAVSKVEFLVDGIKAGEDTSSLYSYALDTSSVSNGNHTIKVVAYDSSNNTAEQSISIYVSNSVQSGDNEYLWLEAENGALAAPMTERSDVLASGGSYTSSSTTNQGTAIYKFNVTTAGNYLIWGRVIAPTTGNDSVFITVDGLPEDVWDVLLAENSSNWTWDRVCLRGAGSPVAPEYDPKLFNLTTGTHTLTIRGREASTYLDKLLITNDTSYVPTGTSEEISSPPAIDIAPPAKPEVTCNTHQLGSRYYADRSPSFSFSSSDDSGVAGYSYEIDKVETTHPDNEIDQTASNKQFSNLSDGIWYFHLKAIDTKGNASETTHQKIMIDTTAPQVSLGNIDDNRIYKGLIDLWVNSSDGLSKVKEVTLQCNNQDIHSFSFGPNYYSLASSSFIWNSSKLNGECNLTIKAVDNAGNISIQSQSIKLDNYKPKTKALRKIMVKRGKLAALRYKVIDPYTNNKARIIIKIKRGKRIVKVLRLGLKPINKISIKKLRVKLRKGKYRYYIYATDLAGNNQHNIAGNWLVVR